METGFWKKVQGGFDNALSENQCGMETSRWLVDAFKDYVVEREPMWDGNKTTPMYTFPAMNS